MIFRIKTNKTLNIQKKKIKHNGQYSSELAYQEAIFQCNKYQNILIIIKMFW